MNWAKCVWEEKFLAPTPLIKIIVTGVVHWTILSLAIQGENSHPRQVVNPLFNSMLVDQPTQVAIFVVYTLLYYCKVSHKLPVLRIRY